MQTSKLEKHFVWIDVCKGYPAICDPPNEILSWKTGEVIAHDLTFVHTHIMQKTSTTVND